MVENWTYSLFFLMAELWGAVVISVLFWTLANEVCTVKEAKTIYPLMGIAANVALVAAGNFMKLVNRGLAVGGLLVCRLCISRCLPGSSCVVVGPSTETLTVCLLLGIAAMMHSGQHLHQAHEERACFERAVPGAGSLLEIDMPRALA